MHLISADGNALLTEAETYQRAAIVSLTIRLTSVHRQSRVQTSRDWAVDRDLHLFDFDVSDDPVARFTMLDDTHSVALLLQPLPITDAGAKRGRDVFNAADCASCHATLGQPDRLKVDGGLALASVRHPQIPSDQSLKSLSVGTTIHFAVLSMPPLVERYRLSVRA